MVTACSDYAPEGEELLLLLLLMGCDGCRGSRFVTSCDIWFHALPKELLFPC